MTKFDMGAAWDDTKQLLSAHLPLTSAIAAVFLFLPTLANSWFGPTPVEPAAGATLEQTMAFFRTSAAQAAPYQLLISIIGAIGGVGILRLWLSRSGTSVGDALGFALKMIPTMIGVQLILTLILAVGALVLIGPGLALGGVGGGLLLVVGALVFVAGAAYFWGRFAVISPVIADRAIRNPIEAIREGVALTRGNVWRIFLFLFLITLVFVIIAMIVGGLIAVFAGSGDGIGKVVTGLLEAVAAAVGGLISLAISAAVYRQLAVREVAQTFG